VRKIVEAVKKGMKKLVGKEDFNNFKIEACGSYRRGKKICGDVDILITRKDIDPK
jgi:DNA polymerase/3'-5' exonuclease PolX